MRSRNHKQFNLKQKHTYSNNVYNNRQRTARPSWGIFCYKLMENIEDTKYLMVRRRNSYAYEEFLRGSYHIDDLNYIRELMSRLTKTEADRILSSEFDDLCYKSADVILELLSEDEKNMILRDKIKNDLRDNNHYGQIATMLIDMGHEKIVDEVGLKPSNFTGNPSLKLCKDIDLNTGEFEPPILSVKINTNTPKNKL